ncbi:hypothetical protein O3783_11635 [Micrococcus luteus]|uniref:hypothetical protein n=1 Tax=Micrococcus luteus TaxID=1270 RepID=UPI0002EF741A
MDTDQTTICTSQNVHIGQEVVIVDRIQLGHCISYADGTVTSIDPSRGTYSVAHNGMRGRTVYTLSDQWHGDGGPYCTPAAEVYGG